MNILQEFLVYSLIALMAVSVLLLAYYYINSKMVKKGRAIVPKFIIVKNDEKKDNNIHNARIRDKNISIYEIAVSSEADFTKHPRGEKIVESIRGK